MRQRELSCRMCPSVAAYAAVEPARNAACKLRVQTSDDVDISAAVRFVFGSAGFDARLKPTDDRDDLETNDRVRFDIHGAVRLRTV